MSVNTIRGGYMQTDRREFLERMTVGAAALALPFTSALVYTWEWSLDQVSWTTALQTSKAKAVLSGLTVGKVYYFRFRVLTRKGKQDPSQVVNLLVH